MSAAFDAAAAYLRSGPFTRAAANALLDDLARTLGSSNRRTDLLHWAVANAHARDPVPEAWRIATDFVAMLHVLAYMNGTDWGRAMRAMEPHPGPDHRHGDCAACADRVRIGVPTLTFADVLRGRRG